MTCRVCGREYEPCRTANQNRNVFHWQEVACSPECGAIYLQRITESRKAAEAPKRSRRKKEPAVIEAPVVTEEISSAMAEAESSEASTSILDTYTIG